MRRVHRRALLRTCSQLPITAMLVPEAMLQGSLPVTFADGTEVQLNIRRWNPRIPNWYEDARARANPGVQLTREQRRELFHNVVEISNKHVPLQHIHPRTKRVERFLELTKEDPRNG